MEENNPKCFTKSKIELFQTNIKENHFMNRTQKHNIEEEEKYRGAVNNILPNQDTMENIEIDCGEEQLQNLEKNQNTNFKYMKEQIGEFIDSSGGTIDAMEVNHYEGSQAAVPEMQTLSSISNNYASSKVLQPKQKEKQNNVKIVKENSGEKAKRRLRELTQLNGEN